MLSDTMRASGVHILGMIQVRLPTTIGFVFMLTGVSEDQRSIANRLAAEEVGCHIPSFDDTG